MEISWLLLLVIQTAFAANVPGGSYGPVRALCPANHSFLREASGISPGEAKWLELRKPEVKTALKTFLQGKLEDLEIENLDDVSIGLAFLGGGHRAMLSGAGQISALDSRTPQANDTGLGGLLQASTYVAGLSGGSWLVGTLAMHNWPTIDEILNQGMWNLDYPIYEFGDNLIATNFKVWKDIVYEIYQKLSLGFSVSLVDVWSRALARQFFTAKEDYGRSLTWSSLRDVLEFKQGKFPMPITVADVRFGNNDILLLSSNSTVMETNPFEFGSWDEKTNAFTDVKYLGTHYDNGVPQDSCVENFDNAGYVMGTSSAVFALMIEMKTNTIGTLKVFGQYLKSQAQRLNLNLIEIAYYNPNPFYNSKFSSWDQLKNAKLLPLVDGGLDYQNVPLEPLAARNVDVLFAFDNGDEAGENWPSGLAIYKSSQRLNARKNGSFPVIPEPSVFKAENLTKSPAFFGCNASAATPLLVYMANSQYSYPSNTSIFDLVYKGLARLGMIQNGFNVASRGGLSADANWQKCASCAIVRRSQQRSNTPQSETCKQCFTDYCYN